jgi:hypothetical protein
LKNLECRAASFGADRLFGDTRCSNDAMISLARKSGYAFIPSPGDWKLVRFENISTSNRAISPARAETRAPPPPSRDQSSRELTRLGPVLAAPEPGRFFPLDID